MIVDLIQHKIWYVDPEPSDEKNQECRQNQITQVVSNESCDLHCEYTITNVL